MLKKKWQKVIVALVIVALVVTGMVAIAAEYGSREDPLVSLSYITDVLTPETMAKVERTAADKAAQVASGLDGKLSSYTASTESKIAGLDSKYASTAVSNSAFVSAVAQSVIDKMGTHTSPVSGAAISGDEWKVVKIASGKTVMLSLGSETVLRIGSGKCYCTGSGVGLVNLSNGSTLSNGGVVAANNLYLVTIEGGRGITATSDMTVLIKGGYSIQ